MKRELRPDQSSTLRRLRLSIAGGHRRPMVQAPTGWGKTMLAAAIVDGALRKGNRIIFAVPALSLIDQAVDAFHAEGLADIGVLQAKHPLTDPAMPVQVASVQTLARRHIPKTDVVVLDEAHRWFVFYETWMRDPLWARVPFIGLSATPWTRGLGRHFDDLIIASTTAELIASGHLAPFRVFAPSHPDLRGVRTVAGDYHEGDLSGVMGRAELVADIVQTWLSRGQDRPTLVFAVDRAHGRLLEAEFAAAGVANAYVDANTDLEERKRIRADFHSGAVRVVVNVGVLTTGVDWDVRCIVLARPTKSEILFVQIIGRGLRTAPGKDHCLILDHSDTTLRLGFVTDIRHDRLDDGDAGTKPVERKAATALKECTSCATLMPVRAAVCAACGYRPRRVVARADGELVEVKPVKAKPGRKQQWFGMLLHVAADRGYKYGWASHKFKERFGHWPAGLARDPLPPDADVERFVRHSIVRFAKRQKHPEQVP